MLRSVTTNPLKRNRGHSYEGIVELGGNLPYVLDRWVFTPDELEGSLPGLPFFRRDRTENRLVYHQYVRAMGDVRRYQPIGRNTILAWRGMAGLARGLARHAPSQATAPD